MLHLLVAYRVRNVCLASTVLLPTSHEIGKPAP